MKAIRILIHCICLSFVFIGGGFWILSAAWNVLYKAQREGKMAVTGLYAKSPASAIYRLYRHYVRLFAAMADHPDLRAVSDSDLYVCPAWPKEEEQDSKERFGKAWDDYAAHVPAFIPKFSSSTNH